MKKRLPLLCIPLFLLYFSGLCQDKWDLKRCVEYAVTNNISIKQSDIQARLAKLTLDQSRLQHIPTLTAGASGAVNSGRFQNPTTFALSTQTTFQSGLSLQGGVTVFNGFYLQRTIDANKFSWEAMLANTDRLKNDISLNVANAYLQVLLANQTMKAADLQLQLSQKQFGLTQKQVAAGALPELNSAELESQVAQDSSTYITAKSNVTQAVLTLKAYMDLDASVPFEVDTPPVDQIPIEQLADLQPDAVYTLALTYQPLQKMDALNIHAADETVRAMKGAMYPSVSLFGGLSGYYLNTPALKQTQTGSGYETIGQVQGTGTPVTTLTPVPFFTYSSVKQSYFTQIGNSFAQQIGLNVSIPILNNGILRTNYAKSKLNLRNQELQRDQDNLTLKNNIYTAYAAAVAALQKFEAGKIAVAATAKSLDYAQKRYNVGMSNTIDLLTNQNNFFNAQVTLLSSQFDYVFKMKVLEYFKGLGIKLTKE
jgi:outer membrane protein